MLTASMNSVLGHFLLCANDDCGPFDEPLSSPLSASGAFYGQPSLGCQHDYSPGSRLRGHALFWTYLFPVYVFVSAISFGVAHQAGCCYN